MRLSLRGVTQNWRLKGAALALAVLLWAVVSAEQSTEQWVPVRVDPVLRDPDYVLTGGPDPAEVRVRVRGPGRELWQLAFGRPTMPLVVEEVGGARRFALDPQALRLPERTRLRPLDVRPAVVRLELERVASKEVPVRARVGEGSRDRWVLADSVRVTPAVVRLSGPEGALARIDSVSTRAFEIVADSTGASFDRRVPLDTAGMEGVSVSRAEVRVSGRVDRREERVVPRVPVWIPPGMAAAPGEVEVRVTGGARALILLSPSTLRAVVPADSLPALLSADGVSVPVRVEGLPPGASARTIPAVVRVTPTTPVPPPPPPPPARLPR